MMLRFEKALWISRPRHQLLIKRIFIPLFLNFLYIFSFVELVTIMRMYSSLFFAPPIYLMPPLGLQKVNRRPWHLLGHLQHVWPKLNNC